MSCKRCVNGLVTIPCTCQAGQGRELRRAVILDKAMDRVLLALALVLSFVTGALVTVLMRAK